MRARLKTGEGARRQVQNDVSYFVRKNATERPVAKLLRLLAPGFTEQGYCWCAFILIRGQRSSQWERRTAAKTAVVTMLTVLTEVKGADDGCTESFVRRKDLSEPMPTQPTANHMPNKMLTMQGQTWRRKLEIDRRAFIRPESMLLRMPEVPACTSGLYGAINTVILSTNY